LFSLTSSVEGTNYQSRGAHRREARGGTSKRPPSFLGKGLHQSRRSSIPVSPDKQPQFQKKSKENDTRACYRARSGSAKGSGIRIRISTGPTGVQREQANLHPETRARIQCPGSPMLTQVFEGRCSGREKKAKKLADERVFLDNWLVGAPARKKYSSNTRPAGDWRGLGGRLGKEDGALSGLSDPQLLGSAAQPRRAREIVAGSARTGGLQNSKTSKRKEAVMDDLLNAFASHSHRDHH